MSIASSLTLQLMVAQLFSPNRETKLKTLRELDANTLNEEPIRVAISTVAGFDRDEEVQAAAKQLMASSAPPL